MPPSGDAAYRLARQKFPAGQVQYADGRKVSALDYMRMVAVTEVANAQRQAVVNFVQGNDTDLVRVSINGSEHLDCAQWEGEVLSVSGALEGFRTVDEAFGDGGLGHPNCVHTLEPVYNQGMSASDSLRKENLRNMVENALRLTRLKPTAVEKRAVLDAIRRAMGPTFQLTYGFVPDDDDPEISITDPFSGFTQTSEGL